MITKKQLIEVISRCKAKGLNVTMKDVAYVILCNNIKEKEIAYKCVFGSSDDFEKYKKSDSIAFLETEMKYNLLKSKNSKKSSNDSDTQEDSGITFEENRAEMLNIIKRTEQALKDGTIDTKDGLKIIADVRTKLNDKFNVNEEVKNQIVVVEKKYNHICEFTHRECYQPTVEDLIEMYKLKKEDE